MKVLIFEDEKLAADHLIGLLKQYDGSIEIIGRLDTVRKGIAWFGEHPQPDLAFFDIQLADGLSFEIFDESEVNCPVIFTTAYNEYALKAFKVNSVDYLLKPIDFDELRAAIDKFRANRDLYASVNYQPALDSVLSMLSDAYKQRFIIKVGEHIRSVPVTQILYFYSMEKATFMHTSDDRSYVIDYSLDQLEQLLDPSVFFRINRKYILSMDSILDIITYSNSRLKVEMKNHKDMDAIVAREKVTKFKQWLDR